MTITLHSPAADRLGALTYRSTYGLRELTLARGAWTVEGKTKCSDGVMRGGGSAGLPDMEVLGRSECPDGRPVPVLAPRERVRAKHKHALDARHKWRRDIKRIKELGPSKDGSRREGVTYRIKLCISPPTPAYTG